jgi:hypothetical protein
MKLTAAVLGLSVLAAAAAAPSPPAARTPDHGLRQAVEEYLRQHAIAAPRELSPDQRAELRRQLQEEYGRIPARPAPQPRHR